MNNKNEIRAEYHKLIRKLNSTNRKENEPTEITFLIQENTLSEKNLISTVNFEKYLKIGSLITQSQLKIDSSFEFYIFAEYLKQSLTDYNGNSDLNKFIHACHTKTL